MYCSVHIFPVVGKKKLKSTVAYQLTGMIHNNLEALEQKGMMPLKVANKDNPYVDAFWQWFPEIYRKLTSV
jgi:hypothetical protein